MFHPLRQSSICMVWVAMSIKIWSLIIVSVKAPPTSIYRAKQSSVFKRMPCLPGSWHMVECGILVITGQFCAGWCYYYFTSSRSQNRIMTCYEWPRNHCAAAGVRLPLPRPGQHISQLYITHCHAHPPADQRAADCHRLIARVKRHRQAPPRVMCFYQQ